MEKEAELSSADHLDEIKAQLCRGEFSSLCISWNDASAANYKTVAEMLEAEPEFYPDDVFVTSEDKKRCIEENSLWTLQWYPESPVGFCIKCASSAALLFQFMESQIKGGADAK
jgi:hypothetical protein